MRITILNKKGISKIVDETLQDMPLNERLERAWECSEELIEWGYEKVPFNVKILPINGLYGNEKPQINVYEPYNSVPDFLVASDKDNKKRKDVHCLNTCFDSEYNQAQLVVLENGIYHRMLNGLGVMNPREIRISNVDSIFFPEIKDRNKSLWEYAVEDRINSFFDNPSRDFNEVSAFLGGYDRIIIPGSEGIKNKVIEILGKRNLKKLNIEGKTKLK